MPPCRTAEVYRGESDGADAEDRERGQTGRSPRPPAAIRYSIQRRCHHTKTSGCRSGPRGPLRQISGGRGEIVTSPDCSCGVIEHPASAGPHWILSGYNQKNKHTVHHYLSPKRCEFVQQFWLCSVWRCGVKLVRRDKKFAGFNWFLLQEHQ